MNIVALLAAALMAASTTTVSSANEFGPRTELETLSGIYASSAPEPWYGGYGTRKFTFENGRWSLVFTHALDPEMRTRTFEFRTEGPYRVGAESRVVPGAFDTVFFEDIKRVTLLAGDPKIVEAFGFTNCRLVLNVEVDVSAAGCAGWKPVSVCREDHDLLAISAAGLFFGVRPRDNDMCTPEKRPTALLMPVIRQ